MTFKNLIIKSALLIFIIEFFQVTLAAEEMEYSHSNSRNINFLQIILPDIQGKILGICGNEAKNLRPASKYFCFLLDSRVHRLMPILESRNRDTVPFLQFINKLPNINLLYLINRNINEQESQDDIAQTLIQSATLKSLSLHFIQIGVKGAQGITQALIQNTTLTSLKINSSTLNNNKIADLGAKYIVQALIQNTILMLLELDDNEIGNDTLQSIHGLLTRNKNLNHIVGNIVLTYNSVERDIK